MSKGGVSGYNHSQEELDHYEDLLPFLTPLVLKDIHKD